MRNVPWCVLLIAAGCVDEEALELSSTESEVMGQVIVQRVDQFPDIEDCTSQVDLPEANLVRFRSAIVSDILPKARMVARSAMYAACMRTTIKQGKSLSVRGWDAWGRPQNFGPYAPRTDDRGSSIVQSLPIERVRDIYAERMISESQGTQPLSITCMAKRSGGASGGGPNPTEDRARTESIHMSKDFFNHDPAPVWANYPFRAFTAAVIWHEVSHERGYHHPDAPTATQAEYNAALAPIAGACMEDTFAQMESSCGLTACPGGRMGLPEGGGDAGSCVCLQDQMTLVDSWDWPALTEIAVNNAGDGYALAWNGAVRTAYQRAGHAWNALGTATKIVAGGDAVALRQTGPGFPKSLQYWSIRPRVGAIENVVIGAGDGTSAALDGFGTFYRTTNTGRVERRRPAGPSQDVGAGTAVVAGSDLAYVVSNGQLDRLDASARTFLSTTTATQHAVDAYGTYHALTSDGTMVRWRGTFFEWVGAQDTAIGAGDNFYARSVNGWVYRLNAEVGWQAIAMCDRFAAGGRSLYCVRGSRLELYAY